MTRLLLLVLGGLGAGVAGSVAGLASLISYPALLAAGLPPVTANVTNTVALVFGSIGSVSGSRPALRGQGPRVRRLAGAAALGGVAGGVLLLLTPAESFERIVPWLIGLASIAILVSPRPVALRPAALQATLRCGHHPMTTAQRWSRASSDSWRCLSALPGGSGQPRYWTDRDCWAWKRYM